MDGVPLRVLHVDDDELVLRTHARLLSFLGWRETGVASLTEARDALVRTASDGEVFDAVLIDLNLPDGDGVDLLPLIAQHHPEAIVAVVSGELDAERSIRLAGHASFVVPKPVPSAAFTLLAEKIVERRSQRGSKIAAFAADHRLSPREADVLRLAADGLAVKEIAAKLGCSRDTIYTYWSRIYDKTGLESQAGVFAAIAQLA